MKKVILKNIIIENWRGQNKTIDFSFDTTIIKGDNRQGKSTVFNSFLWLLTGYDEYDRANYQLYNNKVEQIYENAVPALVEATFDIDSKEYIFKRVAKQGWVRKRGKSEYERSGTDSYSFYLDGIEVSSTQYKQAVETLFAPIDKLKTMLNLRYFFLLDWKDMRKQLELMTGDIQESDFKGDYSIIADDMIRHTPEELKLLYRAQIKPIKVSLDSLPKTIEALQLNLPDLNEVEEAEKAIQEAKKQISDIDSKLVGASDFAKPYIEKRDTELAEIEELRKQYEEAKYKYVHNFDMEVRKIELEIEEVAAYNNQAKKTNRQKEEYRKSAEKSLVGKREQLEKLKRIRENLLEQNRKCKAMQFNGENCIYCGQPLPEDKLEEEKQKFLANKEAEHERIVSTGKSIKIQIEQCEEEIKNLEHIPCVHENVEYKDTSALDAKLADIRESFVPYDKTTEGSAKMSVIEEKQKNLTVIPQQDNEALLNMKRGLLDEIEANSKKLGLKDEYDKQVEKIRTMQEQLRDNSIEIAKLEGKLAKVKEYEEEKAKIISDKVNGNFKYVSVKMSDVNKSGDFIPTCIITDNEGVNATVTNNASRILCGIDISLAFQRHFGLILPLFIDNFESVNKTTLPKIDNQKIMLIFDYCKFKVDKIS